MMSMHHDDASKGQRPEACLILHGDFQLQIMMVDLKVVRIHEEILPSLERSLREDISSVKILRDPVMMDRGTHTVMDGMHRVAALKTLGATYIPVCAIDYGDPKVEVHRWFRSINVGEELSEEKLSRLGFKFSSVSPKRASSLVDGGRFAAVLIGRKASFVFNEPFRDAIEASWIMKEIEGSLREISESICYDTEKDAYDKLKTGATDYILSYPPIKKQEVINSASEGRLFAHKSTRHVIPARPLGLNIPLGLLKSTLGLEEVNERLRSHLLGKKLIRMGRDQVIDGRKYEEEIYLLK